MRYALFVLMFCGIAACGNPDSPQADGRAVREQPLVKALVADIKDLGLYDASYGLRFDGDIRPLRLASQDRDFELRANHLPHETGVPSSVLARHITEYFAQVRTGEPLPLMSVSRDGKIAVSAFRLSDDEGSVAMAHVYRSLPGASGVVAVTGRISSPAPFSDDGLAALQRIVRTVADRVKVGMRLDPETP